MSWIQQGPEHLPLARKSLFYLVSYLTLLGTGLLVSPLEVLEALGATGEYEPYFPRVAGMFLLGLAMVTIAVIVQKLEMLYLGVVGVRLFFSLCFIGFYLASGDLVFLVFFAVVFFGVLLTSTCLLLDRRRLKEAD